MAERTERGEQPAAWSAVGWQAGQGAREAAVLPRGESRKARGDRVRDLRSEPGLLLSAGLSLGGGYLAAQSLRAAFFFGLVRRRRAERVALALGLGLGVVAGVAGLCAWRTGRDFARRTGEAVRRAEARAELR